MSLFFGTDERRSSIRGVWVSETDDHSIEWVQHAPAVAALEEASRDEYVGIPKGPLRLCRDFLHGLATSSGAVPVLAVEGFQLLLLRGKFILVSFDHPSRNVRIHLDEPGRDPVIFFDGHGRTIEGLES